MKNLLFALLITGFVAICLTITENNTSTLQETALVNEAKETIESYDTDKPKVRRPGSNTGPRTSSGSNSNS